MDWRERQTEADWNRDVLMRIVAMLVALAGLADRAGSVSVCRRRRVLGILMHGEVEARSLVIGLAAGAPGADDESDPYPAPKPDAACLAMRLRGLALLLCVLVSRLPGRIGAACPRAGHRKQASLAGFRDSGTTPAPDTS